jgi:hypothetical protein
VAGAAVALCVAVGLWLVLNDAGPELRRAVGDLAMVASSAGAAVCCLVAARRRDAWAPAWRWMGISALVWCAGAAVWAYYGIVLDREPFPSLADVGFVGWALPAAVGLVQLARHKQRRLSVVRVNLDTAVIAGSLFFASWTLVLRSAVYDSGADPWVKTVAGTYPLADAILAALVLAVGSRTAVSRRWPWALLSGAVLLVVLTDSLYVAQLVARTY